MLNRLIRVLGLVSLWKLKSFFRAFYALVALADRSSVANLKFPVFDIIKPKYLKLVTVSMFKFFDKNK